jgi:hypothetical protein
VSGGALTACPACGRETETLDDGRCHYCGQRKPPPPEPAPSTLTGPSPRPATVWEDMRPQLIAAGVAALIAVIGLLSGSTVLLVIAAVLLVLSAGAKILADGW